MRYAAVVGRTTSAARGLQRALSVHGDVTHHARARLAPPVKRIADRAEITAP
jgi:hypothetical protein